MGKNEKKKKKKPSWLIVVGLAVLLIILYQFASDRFQEREKDLRSRLRESVERRFPDQAEKVAASYGLYHFESKKSLRQDVGPSEEPVVLIHGLDDPEKAWMNLAPALAEEGFDVWKMKYPNDQPIRDSARFFFEQLKNFRKLGIRRISIVAHSMGGLVSREMLTNPEFAYSEAAQDGEVPHVTDFIMVGTPNHGSELARFRVLAEFREQWVRATRGNDQWLRGILDGFGGAKVDLLPGSQFLNELNARPAPGGVRMLIIAGIVTPLDDEEIGLFTESLRENLPYNTHDILNGLENALRSATHGLGDGLVTVSSTKLDGVPHQTVHGTHLTIIRNHSTKSVRVPPAVPIIVEHLKQWRLMENGVNEERSLP
jgi:pimeloyl-ACP methyl ester carboxylesterase